MSVQAIGWVLEGSRARLGARLVAISVANHADREGKNAWAAVEHYAVETGMSRRQVQRALRELERLGEIHRCSRRGPKGTNRYCFPAVSGGCEDVGGVILSGASNHTQGATNRTQGVTPMSPEPSSEPSSEPSLGVSTVNGETPRRRRTKIKDAIVAACGWEPASMTASSWKRVEAAAKELDETEASKPTEEVVADLEAFGIFYPRHWPGADITPQAIAGNWPAFQAGALFKQAMRRG